MATNKLKSALKKEANWKQTENGADALKSTQSAVLDLFATVGALRTRNEYDVLSMFENAFDEDALLATKIAFYARNVRGGLGERRTPRLFFNWLAGNQPLIMAKNIQNIPLFGRWDDLYQLVGTSIEPVMWEFVADQLDKDIENMAKGKPVSLLAKWLKSINATSKETSHLGKLTAKNLGYNEASYRKILSALRSYLNVVEHQMSNNQWYSINYEHVPSRAMAIYRKAFGRHDSDGFTSYIQSVQKGDKKINSSTLFPYDIFEKMGFSQGYGYNSHFEFQTPDAVLEEQWKALPNYCDDGDILIMADTSGSMNGRPMCISVGLAVYFAERNQGAFKDCFITFSESPSFVELKGKTLAQRIKNVPSIVANTDIEKAFKLILDSAVANKVPANEMPKALVIISDMEFDSATSRHRTTYQNHFKKMFNDAGYELPSVVYWNVSARQNTFHAQVDENGVQMASGASPSVFQSIMKGVGMNSYDAMLEVLNDEKYNCVVV